MKRIWSMLSLFVIAAMLFAACTAPAAPAAPAGEAPAAEAPAAEAAAEEAVTPEAAAEEAVTPEAAAEAPAAEEAAAAGDRIQLEFWHAMGDNLGVLVDELVTRFNESQDRIFVDATFQGSYDDTYNALLASFESGGSPNIVQNFDLSSQTMIDTGRLVPIWQLMEAEGYDPDILVPAVRDYYSDENGPVGMAFNSSTPLLYYNKEMFAQAGVPDIEGSLTLSEFKALCDQLLAAEVAPYCFAFGQVGWFDEQLLTNSGGLYFNENNGRTGRPTEVLYNQDKGVEVFTFFTDMIKEGYSPNLGNTWSESDTVFTTGQAAIVIDSTSDVSLIENSPFEVGTAYVPHTDSSERNGVSIGGAALWLIDSGDEEINQAAWEFIKFMVEPEQQITWHTGTGYFPVRMDLLENEELQQFWEENPNFRTAIDQLFSTETVLPDGSRNYAALGGRAGPFPAIRRLLTETYSRVLDDGLTPQEALDEWAEKANAELENYNAFFE